MSQRLEKDLIAASGSSLNSRFIEIIRGTNPNDPRVLAHDSNTEIQRQNQMREEILIENLVLKNNYPKDELYY